MADVIEEKKKEFSKRYIFKVYLRTGSKRISLAIISGVIIFLTVTSLVMALYNYRYQTFQTYQEENTDWLHNGVISAGTNHIELGDLDYGDEFFNEFKKCFKGVLNRHSILFSVVLRNNVLIMLLEIRAERVLL